MSLLRPFKIHYWPGLTCALLLLTLIVSYTTAKLEGHVYGVFQYISDSGTVAPESCLFAQLLNIAVVSLGVTHYIRYRQVDIAIDNGDITVKKKWNYIGLWLSCCLAVGASFVANFQETAVLVMHGLGAMMILVGGMSYYAVQTYISYASMNNLENPNQHYRITRKMLYLRTVIVICFLPFYVIMVVCGGLAFYNFKGKQINWWTEEDGGFHARIASSIAEWIQVLLMMLYTATFTNEFKSITFTGVCFTSIKSDNQKSLTNDTV